MAGEDTRMTFCRERATPVALMHCRSSREEAPLEWRAPSEETEQ